ncbi:keratin-like protein KRT222 isoform X1 [Bufo bufo]|uniref:keratin-like protein KRT222 isoform X1 n=2 Tax=Bufo bufo TaxID=8384 RepID=UPI001ABDCED4|nr:keratin-like protein KRT222 isoform X1 [Bufo bufo]
MQDLIQVEPLTQKTQLSLKKLVMMSTDNGFSSTDQKETMRQLNERLADFMKHCQCLEQSNIALRNKIEEQLMKSEQQFPTWDEKEKESQDLLQSIHKMVMENAKTSLEIDKCSTDLARLKQRATREALEKNRITEKTHVLRTMADEFAESISDLKIMIMDKEEEIKNFISNHQEKVQAVQQLKHPIDDIQFATVEDGSRMELSQLLNEIRRHYEALISRSHTTDDLPARILLEEEARQKMQKDEEELRAAQASLYEARKQWKILQTEIESLQAMERSLTFTLHETEQQHQKQLEALSAVIADLQHELQEVREGVRAQLQKHKMLLNTNMKLENEISAYRSLLDSEERRLNGTRQLQEQESSTSKIGFNLPSGPVHKSSKVYRESPDQQDKDQAIFNGNLAEEGAEATGTVQTEKVDEMIKRWEGSFFKDNPKLRKKSVSLRFDLHMAAADEACFQTKKDNLPDIEVRLIMRRSSSIPTMSP